MYTRIYSQDLFFNTHKKTVLAKNEPTIKIKSVSKSDYRFLYNLLMERDARANISHKKMPTYNEHVKFVSSKPYPKWYIILCDVNRAGSIYLTSQNEIGIFIKKSFQNKQIGDIALRKLIQKNPKKRYLANVNPKNKKSICFFKNHGFKLIQYTFELSKI
jgi:RimJ/RimL family protein N-acetyltransferase|tara:strand:+ start:292 stop:771 length:480 start_codon:yes stop_codon:yes gene_type:complete